MLYPPMSELLKRIDSRYLLVNVVARRARELSTEEGQLQAEKDKKPVTQAIEEVSQDKLMVKTGNQPTDTAE